MPIAEIRETATRPVQHPGFSRFAWAVLAFNLGVVLWGGYVRATGSGAGCGDHWPLCNGQVTPVSPTIATLIEFTHRATSGIDLVLVALLVLWAFRSFPKGHPARRGATLAGLFLMMEAALGAGLVLLKHVAKNPDAYWQSAHLMNTLTLLACLTLTAWWGMGRPDIRLEGIDGLTIISIGSVVVLSVSGVIAALGDTLYPAQSLASGIAQDFAPGASLFVRWRWLHPAVACIGAAWLVYYAMSTAARRPDLRGRGMLLIGCVAAQVLAGVVNLVLLAPVGMQIVHLLLADLLWISLVVLSASANACVERPDL